MLLTRGSSFLCAWVFVELGALSSAESNCNLSISLINHIDIHCIFVCVWCIPISVFVSVSFSRACLRL